MYIAWHSKAWNDYLYWQTQDKKTLKRINALLKDIVRNPSALEGLGVPEALMHDLSGIGGYNAAAGFLHPVNNCKTWIS